MSKAKIKASNLICIFFMQIESVLSALLLYCCTLHWTHPSIRSPFREMFVPPLLVLYDDTEYFRNSRTLHTYFSTSHLYFCFSIFPFLLSDKAPSEAVFRGAEFLSYDQTGGGPIVSAQDSVTLYFKTRQSNGLLFYTGKKSD